MSGHSHDHGAPKKDEKKLGISASSSLWFFIIIAGLFIASVNFVKVMGSDEGHGDGHGGHESTHQTHAPATHDDAHDDHASESHSEDNGHH